MKPDSEVFQGKIDLIEEHLDLLEELTKRDYEEFIVERLNVLATKHRL